MSYNGVYLLAGYPNPQAWSSCLRQALSGGFDFVELGIPYSDPVADGPVIWQAAEEVLRQGGIDIDAVMDQLRLAQPPHAPRPCYLMVYANLLLSYGLERFCQRYAHELAGVIVPDLPLLMHRFFRERGFTLPLVPFVTPESELDDLRQVAHCKADFVYLVSTRGITGSRVDFAAEALVQLVQRTKERVGDRKVVLGFGVRERADVQRILAYADGFIVGSQAVSRQGDPADHARYLAQLLG